MISRVVAVDLNQIKLKSFKKTQTEPRLKASAKIELLRVIIDIPYSNVGFDNMRLTWNIGYSQVD